MKEIPLNFNTNENPTIVVLTEKQTKDFKKASDDLRFAMAHLTQELAKGLLSEGMKETLASLIETYSQSITESLGYKGALHSKKEERFAEIRKLNEDNRELRKQLGEKNTPEDVRESLKNLADNFKRWWNIEGFGHCSDESFGGYGFKAKLSGMITDAYYSRDKDADTEDEKADKLRKFGFEVVGEGKHSRDYKIPATENNLLKLTELLKSKYPCVDIFETTLYSGRGKETSEIRSVEIFISNFDELFESKIN
jgi:hypothetical protein